MMYGLQRLRVKGHGAAELGHRQAVRNVSRSFVLGQGGEVKSCHDALCQGFQCVLLQHAAQFRLANQKDLQFAAAGVEVRQQPQLLQRIDR